ncbi:QWRF motif-containing protein 2-like [Mercurialis annua]|uniref:QWRF motif-containing protein 2-like n=1 Tax=Mercurialis annua TaxID=3986 RepID=UPI0021610BD9|nr:QWRF motif-containing protein 2-like [Mercurialis annua]
MMVAAVSTTLNPKTTPNHNSRTAATRRPPLIPSEPDNANANANAIAPPRRPKSREVSSRYMSSPSTSTSTSSTPKRSPSPLISRPAAMMTPISSAPSTIKRSVSAERRRPSTPRFNSTDWRVNGNGVEMSSAERMLITSTRSLSVSFQGESFSYQVSKAKPAVTPSAIRKGTPERRKATPMPARGADQVENNSRPWPGRSREPNSLSRSVDWTDDRRKLAGSGVNLNVVRALQNSMMDYGSNNNSSNIRSSIVNRLSSDSISIIDVNRSDTHYDHSVASDTESVSSGSTTEGVGNGGRARGVCVPARFWQETNNRTRRQPEPGSPVSRTAGGLKGLVPPKLIAPKKIGIDSPVSSPKGTVNSRRQSSPIRGGGVLRPASPIRGGGVLRPASPSKLGTPSAALSPVRGVSPSRMRNVVGAVVNSNIGNMNTTNTPSILSFAADIRRGKSGEHRIVEVHLLRILYNRLLQWRFVNARADTSLSAQRMNAEKSLYTARVTILKLRESVIAKRTALQCLRQNLKIISILKGQMIYLEELAHMDQEFSCSLSGAIEALRASTLRLPVVGGARADIPNVKDAVCSAVDVMQAMASSICLLSSKVGDVNSLVVELANVASKERALLDQCKDLLSIIAALQVKECSLRTHFIQLKRVPFSLTSNV